MSSVVLCLRLVLAVVFGTAASAKLRDRAGFRETVVAFGVPLRRARPVALAVPCAELATAVALLVQGAARWGAVGAATLLILFSGAVSRALSRGLAPDCNCFGQLSSEQVSWRTLARNAVFSVVAVIVIVWAPGSELTAWTANAAAANLVAALAVIAAALLGVSALDYARRAAAPTTSGAVDPAAPGPPEGLPPGAPAPAFELPDLNGAPVSLDALREPGLPVVLVFASPTCAPCAALVPELVRWASALGERVTIAVVESEIDDPRTVTQLLPDPGDLRVLVEPERDLATSFGVIGTPTGVAVNPDGQVASQLAMGSVGIEGLIRAIVRTGRAVSTAPEPPVAARPS